MNKKYISVGFILLFLAIFLFIIYFIEGEELAKTILCLTIVCLAVTVVAIIPFLGWFLQILIIFLKAVPMMSFEAGHTWALICVVVPCILLGIIICFGETKQFFIDEV
ncbi:MAG: hypothetical protein PHG24_01120 [Candidatus Pacebacteria bacterium]|nr:hypothetical protein [Candidatus Paceibacterota bacterium]